LEGNQGQPEAALAWYDRAITAFKTVCAKKPTDVLAGGWLLSARGERAEALNRLGRLQEAESAYLELEQSYQEAIQRNPSDHWNWYSEAPLRLRRGDLEGYRRVCREMLARFSRTDDPMIAERTAKTCLLVPDAVGDIGPVLDLADRAVTGTEQINVYDWFLLARGMADYRAGRIANAIDCLNKVLSLNRETRYRSDWALPATAQLFLAMAHHRLGRVHEARHALNQATELMEQPCPFGYRCQFPGYPDWLRFQLVRPEAERLVKGKAAK
jgi:tetratricopeptide (TPR) repeat protein